MSYRYEKLMCAYLRGYFKEHQEIKVDKNLLNKELDLLTNEEVNILDELGKKHQLKNYYFKDKDVLARVSIVLGFLRNIYPETLLDVGSGRGVFLFPLLKEFPYLKVTSVDIISKRVEVMEYMNSGGIDNLIAINGNICNLELEDNSYEIVTMLEVLEHIPNVSDAVKNAVRIAKNFIVVTVPSKEDDNPEHIHLLTKEKLTKLFNEAGITNLKFGGVNGHLLLIARKK